MTDTEALVRRAYHFAQGDVLDIRWFIDLFGATLDIPCAQYGDA